MKKIQMYLGILLAVIILSVCTPVRAKAATQKAVTIKTKLANNATLYVEEPKEIGATASTTSTFTYKSNNTKIASVDSKGKIRPVAVGTAKITITAKPKSTKYKATTKVLTVRVIKPKGVYKIIYHYSEKNASQQVKKSVKVGSTPTLASAKDLNFTSKNNTFIGWHGYMQKTNKWKVYSKNLETSEWGVYDKKYLYTFAIGSAMKEKMSAGEELHLYGQWSDEKGVNLNLPYFRSMLKKTGDKKDSAQMLQSALDLANKGKQSVKIRVPKGTYYISKTLVAYSNTKLILSSDAVIRRLPNAKGPMLRVGGGSNRASGYKQAHDVTVQGGTWIGNPIGGYNNGSIIRFIHSQKILLKDCTIENYSGKHAVVFAGVNYGTVDNVTFQDQMLLGSLYTMPKKKQQFGEAIHIDTTSQAGEPDAYPIDNTVCDNMVVKNSVFDNVLSGVGSHLYEKKKSKSYKILNNEFHDVKYYCLTIYNKNNAEISGNRVYKFNQFIKTYNSIFIKKDDPIRYQIDAADKISMRGLYTQVIQTIDQYTFPRAGKNVKRYEYFLRDMNGDGIREMVVGAVFTENNKQYRDCMIFTCRKSSTGYSLKRIYGSFVGDTLYIPASGGGIYNRSINPKTGASTVYRMTLSANTVKENKMTSFARNTTEETKFVKTNKKAVWISQSNLAALSLLKE